MINRHWEIKVFISNSGNDVIDAWLNEIPPRAKAKIKVRMTYLENEIIWKAPYVKKLRGSKTIWEIRVVLDHIQYRLLGCFGPGEKNFTLLIGAIEKGNRLYPPDAINTAEKRCKLIRTDKRYTDEYN